LVTLQADLIVISWFISESTFFPCMLSLHSAFRFRLRLRGLSFRKLLASWAGYPLPRLLEQKVENSDAQGSSNAAGVR